MNYFIFFERKSMYEICNIVNDDTYNSSNFFRQIGTLIYQFFLQLVAFYIKLNSRLLWP